MPRLMLLRHAKAESAGKGGGRDHDRALGDRGRRDADEAGRIIAGRGEPIELVLCSTSLRTRETWDSVQAALREGPEVRFLRQIYEAQDTYLDLLRSEAGTAGSVLLVGHNPAIQDTAVALGGGANRLPSGFPTAALAIFDFDGSWSDLAPGAARLVDFITPSAPGSD